MRVALTGDDAAAIGGDRTRQSRATVFHHGCRKRRLGAQRRTLALLWRPITRPVGAFILKKGMSAARPRPVLGRHVDVFDVGRAGHDEVAAPGSEQSETRRPLDELGMSLGRWVYLPSSIAREIRRRVGTLAFSIRRYGISISRMVDPGHRSRGCLLRTIFGALGARSADPAEWVGCKSRTSKPARSRQAPGPSADRRRLWVIAENGLGWSPSELRQLRRAEDESCTPPGRLA